jgi:hypothetical protein
MSIGEPFGIFQPGAVLFASQVIGTAWPRRLLPLVPVPPLVVW